MGSPVSVTGVELVPEFIDQRLARMMFAMLLLRQHRGEGKRDDHMPSSLTDEIVREGARRILGEALRAEVDAYVAQFADDHDESGHRRVVRNGYH